MMLYYVDHIAYENRQHPTSLCIPGRGFSKFKKTYRLKGELGRGGFGIVYRAVRISDETPVAVKFIERGYVREWGKLNDERVPMEICMLARCASIRGVIKLLEWFSMPEGFLIVMERPYPCVDLFDFIKTQGSIDEDLARFLFRQVAETIVECARQKVLHRDIKDENVVIDLVSGETRLIDFGAATPLKKTHYTDFQGTRLYCPPEWFLHALYLGEEAAVWSLGVLLYNMLNGRLPFRNEKDICTSHLLGPLPFHTLLSDEAKDLMERCLRFDPFARCSLDEVVSHPWVHSSTADWLTLTAIADETNNAHTDCDSQEDRSDSHSETCQQQSERRSEAESNHDSANCSRTSSMYSALSGNDDDNSNVVTGSEAMSDIEQPVGHVVRLAKTSLIEPPNPKQLAAAVIHGTHSRKTRLHKTSSMNNRTHVICSKPKVMKQASKCTMDSGRSSAMSSSFITSVDVINA
ncbi:unnamed protein product [Toxocara canis]|uniref:non-specific serine/threonine protein kinase n=1 Tax=Toxocara canis TaxID=6265 RepID=A0A183UCU9_TOXCA|nr:unnamed protein product [Toxocara canis]